MESLQTYTHFCSQNKLVILAWIPSHVDIKGNKILVILAKEVLGLDITPLKNPYIDLKNKNKYVYQHDQRKGTTC